MALFSRSVIFAVQQKFNYALNSDSMCNFYRYISDVNFNQFSSKKTGEHLKEKTSGLTLTESCINRLEKINVNGSFLRILVEGGGCSGFQYKFNIDNKLNESDVVFGNEKGRVVIDLESLEYCDGATVDYHTELIRSGFRILTNPKANHGCSCGASFTLKID